MACLLFCILSDFRASLFVAALYLRLPKANLGIIMHGRACSNYTVHYLHSKRHSYILIIMSCPLFGNEGNIILGMIFFASVLDRFVL